MAWLPVFGIYMFETMLKLAIAHGSYKDIVIKSQHWQLALGEISLAALGTRTRLMQYLYLAFQSDTTS